MKLKNQLTWALFPKIPLALAASDAQRGRYAPVRPADNRAFSPPPGATDGEPAAGQSPAPSAAAPALLAERDELMAWLTRNDPADGPRLARLYAAYRQITAQ